MPKVQNVSGSNKFYAKSDRLEQEWTEFNRFHLKGEYSCPVCRHGKVSEMLLMETFACNFCQHIFTANFEKQLLKMADSQLPLTWYWNGKGWKGIQREGSEIGWAYLIFALGFVFIPTGIIALGTYLFPPLSGSSLSWLPFCWIILTFCAHLSFIIWLIIEYYQFPIFLYIRALKRKLLWSRIN
jgi:rubredoxin